MRSAAIGILPDYAVADELAAGSLVALDMSDPVPPVALCMTTQAPPRSASPLESLVAEISGALTAPAAIAS
jgi:DNA-binding transcriptional LysR family regulator